MFAWFINELTPKIRAVVTLIFYAPSISGQVYLIWQTLFSSDQYGWVNGTLMKLGIINSPILWFQDTDYIMTLVIMVALWTSLGTSFLSFIAGFQVVDKSLYEAASVDGVKNRWQELWYRNSSGYEKPDDVRGNHVNYRFVRFRCCCYGTVRFPIG